MVKTLDLRECSSRCDDGGGTATFGPSAHPRIAPARPTIVFIGIFVGLSVMGFFQNYAKLRPQTTVQSGNAADGYIFVTVCEWLLVLCVRMGVHRRGVRLRDLVDGRWATPIAAMKDIASGLWAGWIGPMNAQVPGGGINDAQGITQSLT